MNGASTSDATHLEGCDVLDLQIQGKPCNCSVYQQGNIPDLFSEEGSCPGPQPAAALRDRQNRMNGASKLDRVVHYHGSKYSLAPWILSFLPPHDTFVDAFGGSGAMFCAKPPVPFEVYNDLGSEVVNFFRVLRTTPEPLAHALALTPWSREEWLRAWEATEDPIERARRFLVRSWQNRGGPASKTGWRYQRKDTRGSVFVDQWGLLPPRLLMFASRMKHVQIECLPFVDVIKRYDSPSTVHYADPPYLPTLRSAKSTYEVEMTAEDHERLASALYGVQGYCLVSGYRSDLYHDLYEKRGWTRKDKTVMTGSGSRAVESLWLCPRTFAACKQMELFGVEPVITTGGAHGVTSPQQQNIQ